MSTTTPNLKLTVPIFDQVPWDVDVNTNWAILDASVGMFASIPNLTGLWKNATAYTYGQSTIDGTDSSVWMCVQTHTSSAAPVTFSQERVTFPGRWAMTANGAQFYASQAASSASAAANSAAAAAADAARIGNALPITGGTMTGFITLNADPTGVLHAVTKQYVDARVGGTGFMPVTGGTFTGPVTAGANGFAYSNIAVADRQFIGFGFGSGGLYYTANGVGQGALATQSYVSGSFLPLSGGSLTGTVYTAGELQAAATVRLLSSGAFFNSSAGETVIVFDSSGWSLRYNRSTGRLVYNNSAGTTLFSIDGSSGVAATAGLSASGNIVSAASGFFRGGNVYWGAGDRARLSSDNSTFTGLYMLDAYGWVLSWSTGTISWNRYDGTSLFNISAAGNANLAGQLNTGGAVIAGTTLYASGQNMVIGNGGAGRIMQYQSNWYWDWNSSNGTLSWNQGGTFSLVIRTTDNLVYNQIGPMGGIGPYYNGSDERMKTNIQPATNGLEAIRKLEPISFNRLIKSQVSDQVEHGFSAQQLRGVIPEAVRKIGHIELDGSDTLETDDAMLSVSIDPIVVALVNGMKELITRIEQIEGRP